MKYTMNKPVLFTLSLLASAALALPLAAQARPPDPGAVAVQKTTAKKPARQTKKGVPYKAAKAVDTQTPVQTLTERLTEAELAIAPSIYTGTFPCELGAQVTITADAEHPGFFTVTAGKNRYYMHPVESRTGAIRMEDNRRGAVWLQLGSKSMLMDQRAGQRVADDCKTVEQRDYATHMQDQPRQQLLDRPASVQPPPQPDAGAAPVGGGSSPEPGASAS
jgi:hypothetical protein